MSDYGDFAKGALMAMIGAGPIGAAIFWIAGLIAHPWDWQQMLISIMPLLGISFIIGFIVSAIPAILGSYAMTQLGETHHWARIYRAWGAGGALFGGGTMILIETCFVGLALTLLDIERTSFFLAFGAVTGTLCALLARRYVRWSAEP